MNPKTPAAVNRESDAARPVDAVIDLRERGSLPAHTYAYYRLRELQPGGCFELLSDEAPGLTLDSVNAQFRNRLHWEVIEAGPPLWRIRVQPRDDTPVASLKDLLTRDHERLDRLFAEALARVNAGDLAGAGPLVQAFAEGLRRHVHVENDLLAPVFVAPRTAGGDDPTSTMLREHEEILEQVALIEASLEGGPEERSTAATFMALLSGTLAKHEFREEQNLFPFWNQALERAIDPDQARALLDRVTRTLAGGPEK